MRRTLARPPDAAELRRQAEAKLSKRRKKDAAPPATDPAMVRLVNELQVHQIELEMQNEELLHARAESEALLRQYTDLYDFAPVGYFTLSPDGTILHANLAGARVLGVEVGRLITRRFGAFVPIESRVAFADFLERVFSGGNREACEIELAREGADPLWAHIEAVLSEAENGQREVCRAVVSDITARRQAEEELRHLSTHDALTGLYSRNFFVEEMARFERGRGFPVSIVMADVDDLKETNDRDGHAAGDVLLRRVAQVLITAFRAEDVIARIGGDEFAVLLPATGVEAANASLQRVRQVIQEDNAAHTEAPISLSLGVSTAERPAPLAIVLRDADAGMYRDKRGHEAHHPTAAGPEPEAEANAEAHAVELRRRSEVRVSEREARGAPPPAPQPDTWRVVHELQVHEIELEMQNQELTQARGEVEDALRLYTDLYDFAPVGCFTLARDGTIHKANIAGIDVLGVERAAAIDRRFGVFVSFESRPAFNEFLDKVFAARGSKETCELKLAGDGPDRRWAQIEASTEDGQVCRAVLVEITERKRAEATLHHRVAELEALHAVSAVLRTAQTSEEALPVLLDETLTAMETEVGAIWLYHPDSGELRIAASRGGSREFGDAPMRPGEGIAGTVFASGEAHVSVEIQDDPADRAMTCEHVPGNWGRACVPIRTGSATVGALFVSLPRPREVSSEQLNLLESLAEMAGTALHRVMLHEATVRQLDQLEALHRIDQAIAASLDVRTTCEILVEHVTAQLRVDAASVLLFSSDQRTLQYAAGRGFRTDALANTRLWLGEGAGGRAALERQLVCIPNLRARKTGLLRSPVIAAEGFEAYFSVPIIFKGQVKGVLEVFNRTPLEGGSAWLSFFETLAERAAIAIDNAQLFHNLQCANADLVAAYDRTIEGWSRALDLRDRQTEGHTLRVTELTMRLAQAAGVSAGEFAHIRRGALLHDIGKMGIPDDILLKPGKLTDAERVVMRTHPQMAVDMSAPITYLKSALDIPYCHHERWDGTGYPRGLKGEEIPLAARLFAVVDVWDALRSDRPYREAWPESRVLEHIRAGSGAHFDPKAVELFMHLVNEGVTCEA